MTQQAIVINSKLPQPSATQVILSEAKNLTAGDEKILAYITRLAHITIAQSEQIANLTAKVEALTDSLSQRPALPAASFPNASGNPDNLVVDMARSIYRTVANGKLYWHVRTTRYAKHGVALWPDPETLAALDISEEWLKSLPIDRETPYLHKVCIALDADGKKPKVIGLA